MVVFSPEAKDFFAQFLCRASRTSLQTIDWERFYIFVVVCHETKTECSHEDLQRVLAIAGFRDHLAASLANAFAVGREILKTAQRHGAQLARTHRRGEGDFSRHSRWRPGL